MIPRGFISVMMSLVSVLTYARPGFDVLFEQGRELNSRKEFFLAAETFVKAREAASDETECLRALCAEGECYYMLDLAVEMKTVLDEANKVYDGLPQTCDPLLRLELQEAIAKLTGSYNYCVGADGDALAAYTRCLGLISQMKSLPGSVYDGRDKEAVVHRELLSLYYRQKKYDKALEEATEVFVYRRDMVSELPAGEDYDAYVDACVSRAMVLARLKQYDRAIHFLDVNLPEGADKDPVVLRARGKILILRGDSEDLKCSRKCYEDYLNYFKRELTSDLETLTEAGREQHWLAMHSFLYDCFGLEDSAADLLYDVSLFSKGFLADFGKRKQGQQVDWRQVSDVLEEGSCAVEFVEYVDRNEVRSMAALVLRKDAEIPVFCSLGSVDELLSTELTNGQPARYAIVNDIPNSKDVLYSDLGFAGKIWNRTLLDAIGPCRQVFFAPDGFLHQLAIEYLYPKSSVDCHRLSSTRMLVTAEKTRITGRLLACGGLDYNAVVQSATGGNDVAGYRNFGGKPIYLNHLYGTEEEVDAISQIVASGQCILLKGTDATDELFCKYAQSGPHVVHLATHGYFSGENRFDDMKPLYRDRSMSESGLMMSGAARNLNDPGFNPHFSDGIITAKELSGLDLSEVDLMVLSACQSGLGYITADGVYGVQRAMKISGVGAMVVSLWSVDDQATTMFMKTFYQRLQSGEDMYEAFSKTRKSLLRNGSIEIRRFDSGSMGRRSSVRKITDPRYANAFILIDAL